MSADRLPYRARDKLEGRRQRAPRVNPRFFADYSRLNVYAAELEVRLPAAPTIRAIIGPVDPGATPVAIVVLVKIADRANRRERLSLEFDAPPALATLWLRLFESMANHD
jgi:hypothetical protein